MITIKPETDLYNNDAFALYINGTRTHLGSFSSIAGLREYWNSFRSELIQGPGAIDKLIFGY
jgi:hypothetical protein